jgi:hypothetical protein
MKKQHLKFFFLSFMAIVLLSSCGSLTKMRYSRGFKSNFEFRSGKKEGEKERLTAARAVKKQGREKVYIASQKQPEIVTVDPGSNENLGPGAMNNVTEAAHKLKLRIKKTEDASIPDIIAKNKTGDASKDYGRPVEPNSQWAGILFLGGILFTFLFAGIGFILMLVAFVLAIIGIHKINQSGGLFGGLVIDILVIILFLVYLVAILYIILLFALFFSFI